MIVPNGWNIEMWDNRSWHNIVDLTTYSRRPTYSKQAKAARKIGTMCVDF